MGIDIFPLFGKEGDMAEFHDGRQVQVVVKHLFTFSKHHVGNQQNIV